MSDIYDEFEEVIRRHRERDTAAQREAETNERFDRIESSIGALAESVNKFVSGAAPPPPGDDGVPPGEPPQDPPSDPPQDPPADPPPPELPVQRVTQMPVPRVYNGDDEPAEVEYIDPESGETKKRPGRRKGHPTKWAVENVEPEPPAE